MKTQKLLASWNCTICKCTVVNCLNLWNLLQESCTIARLKSTWKGLISNAVSSTKRWVGSQLQIFKIIKSKISGVLSWFKLLNTLFKRNHHFWLTLQWSMNKVYCMLCFSCQETSQKTLKKRLWNRWILQKGTSKEFITISWGIASRRLVWHWLRSMSTLTKLAFHQTKISDYSMHLITIETVGWRFMNF